MAHAVLDVQPGGSVAPRTCRNWFTGPDVGLKSMFHTTATATSDVTYGRKNAVRKKPRPASARLSRSARQSETTMVSGMCPAA